MNLNDLLKADELYFIDLETVGGSGICQIGITRWSRWDRRLSLVFDEIINPEVLPESINIHALKVHSISEYMWSKAKPYSYYHSHLRNNLKGKIVLQWGGSDIGIIKKNIAKYRLDDLNVIELNSWNYHYKGVKLATAAQSLGFSYTGLHDAAYDSCLTALLFVSEFCGYKVQERDFKFINSLNPQSPNNGERFKLGNLETNGKGEEVCLTGFTTEEKMKFAGLLTEKGYRIRTSVNPDLKFLVTPSKTYDRSPGKVAEARRVGAAVIDLNSLLESFENTSTFVVERSDRPRSHTGSYAPS